MNPLFLYACVFSFASVALVWWLERRSGNGSERLIRFSLLLLLLMPALLCLPKWHILPAPATVFPVMEAANQSTPHWLWWLWSIGMSLCVIRLFLSVYQLRRWKKNSHPVSDTVMLDALASCAQHQGFTRPIDLRLLNDHAGPAACGWRKPIIYLPADSKKWSAETLRAVLLHEIGHHVSHDPLWRIISLLSRSLHWYNPFVSWLAKQLHHQSEVACDARVIHAGFRKENYAHILCDLAAHAPQSAMAMASPSGLEKRVRQLGKNISPIPRVWLITWLVSLFLLALCVSILRPARDPGTPIAPTNEDAALRLQADPFPVK
jgi:beta-lactamase regulating signal transducer with metallopeptidase domain